VPEDATPDQELECLQTANISLIGMETIHGYNEFQRFTFIYAGLDQHACQCLKPLPLYKPLDKVTANLALAGGIAGFFILFAFIGTGVDRCIYGDNSKVE